MVKQVMFILILQLVPINLSFFLNWDSIFRNVIKTGIKICQKLHLFVQTYSFLAMKQFQCKTNTFILRQKYTGCWN